MGKKGKLEAEISGAVIKYQRDIIGRGPEDARTYIINDMVVLRLKGVLTVEERHLCSTDRGRQVVKQMRQILRETFAAEVENIIAKLTGCQVISSHSDVSTKTGERVEIFILDRNLEAELKKD